MREYKIRDGAVVEFREGREFREVFSVHHGYLTWLAAGNAPEPLPPLPGPSLEQAKATKRAAIQARKVQARDAGFTVNGVHFDSDYHARVAYLEAKTSIQADPTWSTPWKASEGVWVVMDAALYAQVEVAGTAHVRAAFARQAELDAALDTCATVGQVDALNIEHGWPSQ